MPTRNNREKHSVPKQLHDFKTLTWKGAPLDGLKEYLTENIDLISTHPQEETSVVQNLLSRRMEVKNDELLLTNGALSAYYIIAKAYHGARSLIFRPTTNEVREALCWAEHEVVEGADGKDLSKVDLTDIDIVWLQTPNSPDGRSLPRRKILALLKAHPDKKFVVDLSMANYLIEPGIKASDVEKYPNLIVLSSFSYSYNLLGLRIGYLVAEATKVAQFATYALPYSVGTMALSAIHYVLVHPAVFTIPLRKWLRESQDLADLLGRIEGVEVKPSNAPFFTVNLPGDDARELTEFLLKKHNILVGTADDNIDLAANQIRVCPQAKYDTNELLVTGITEFYSPQSTN